MKFFRHIPTLMMLVLASCASRPALDLSCPAAWTQRGGKAVYTFEEGMIIGETRPNQPNSFLCTNQTFAEFDLEYDFLVDAELNSGVQIRSHSLPEYQNGRVHGLQVEIDPSPRAWTAGLYDEGRKGWLADLKDNQAAREAFHPGQWNHVKVVADGPHVQTWLNGVPAAELRDAPGPEGFIGLQVHDVGPRTDPLRVRWRNIVIRPLPKPEARAFAEHYDVPF